MPAGIWRAAPEGIKAQNALRCANENRRSVQSAGAFLFRGLRELESRIALQNIIDRPLGREHQQAAPAIVLQQLRVARQVQVLQVGDRGGGDEPQLLIRQALHPEVDAVFRLHAVLEHVKLQRTDDADDDLLHAGIWQLEDLDRALLCDLLGALDELLALHRVLRADAREMLRRKRRDPAEAELLARHGDRVADGEDAGVEHTDDVARVCFLDDLALRRHQLLRLGKAHFFAALHVVIFAVALKLAGADAQEGQPVAVRLVHVCLNFEDERREIGVERVDLAAVGHTRQGRRRHAEEFLEERLHTEIRQRRAEEHRRQLPMAHLVHVEFASRAEQLHIVAQLCMPPLAEDLRDLWIVQRDGQLVRAVLAGHTGKQQQLLPSPVIHALELLAGADGPVAGIGLDAELVFQFVQQLERIARLAVHLVDEREDRDVAHRADLEQLARLRLDALGPIDDHDGAVRRHQCAVRVLGKVLMARRVQNVDAEALILKLHDRRRDRDAALLFDFHPVGHRGTGILLALDRARLRDGPAVEQKFFCQCGFTGVRVRNDRERPPPGDLFF